jgi:hypothetical protein
MVVARGEAVEVLASAYARATTTTGSAGSKPSPAGPASARKGEAVHSLCEPLCIMSLGTNSLLWCYFCHLRSVHLHANPDKIEGLA